MLDKVFFLFGNAWLISGQVRFFDGEAQIFGEGLALTFGEVWRTVGQGPAYV